VPRQYIIFTRLGQLGEQRSVGGGGLTLSAAGRDFATAFGIAPEALEAGRPIAANALTGRRGGLTLGGASDGRS